MTGKGSVGWHPRVPLREREFIRYFIYKLKLLTKDYGQKRFEIL